MSRRKQSADEHQATGTYRKDRHEQQPQTIGLLKELPEAPWQLSKGAQQIYAEVGAKLITAALLKATDLHTLAQYASEQDYYERCMEVVGREELTTELHTKVIAPNPARKLAETALKNMLSLGDRLGLSPRSRYTMRGPAAFADEEENEDSPILDLMNRKKKDPYLEYKRSFRQPDPLGFLDKN